jgi:hypothetical protein
VHIHTIQVSKSFYRQLTRCEKARAVSTILYKGIILRDSSLEGAPADLSGGVHCNLSNNAGGTNYIMWFGEDMRFRFLLRP